jgi:hypothetical protein
MQSFYRSLPNLGRFFGGVRDALPESPAIDEPDIDKRRTTVTAQSTSIRRSVLLATALASLALAPQALASTTTPPDRTDGLGGANQTSHIVGVLPPDRVDGLGGAATIQATVPAVPDRVDGLGGAATIQVTSPAVPDRVDGLGSSRFTPVVAPTVIVRGAPSGFDWTAAILGAIAGLGIALVAMAGLLARGRRDVALPS